MIILLLFGLLILGLVLWFTTHSSLVPWLDHMTRLNPGVAHRAEWIAPPLVVEAVKRDYLDFYAYAARTLPLGWMTYTRELDRYLCGEMLESQVSSLANRLRHDRGRVVGILRANHSLYVRNFSPDGMHCILIDRQTEQRLATYDYWEKIRLHTQDMGDQVLVYQMEFDLASQRWKIASFVQHLPPGVVQGMGLAINLPTVSGRDQ